ncbi:mucin-6-like [Vanacampus margaritifer]
MQEQGLCGNANMDTTNDFTASNGIIENSVHLLAQFWSVGHCEQGLDQCINANHEYFADENCAVLTDPSGIFAKYHAYVLVIKYHKVLKKQEFSYDTRACNLTCHSLSGADPRCQLGDGPVDGCGCQEGTHLNEGRRCTSKAECQCHHQGTALPPGPVHQDHIGNCVPLENCTCVYSGEVFSVGQTVKSKCKSCTCNRCKLFGNGHVQTFDSKWCRFDGHCQYTLVELRQESYLM